MNSYYESNRPYNPQESNRPIINVVPVDERMKKDSVLEGAAWGASAGALKASLYSAGVTTARSEGFRNLFKEGAPNVHKSLEGFDKFASSLEDTYKKNSDVKGNDNKRIQRMATGTVFGKGFKSALGRAAIASVPGAITGGFHNASNGIIGPY